MEALESFWESVKAEQEMLLATCENGSVTMRTVSPVYYEHAILIFTAADSRKYRQLQANPNCCVALGGCFLEAKAAFLGRTMLEQNAPLRAAYAEKFHDAFAENVAFGGRDAEFLLLRPVLLTGWGMENGVPTGPFEYRF